MKLISILLILSISLNSSIFFDKSVERAIENRIYNVITDINKLNKYINRYILTYADAPSIRELRGEYDEISALNWPQDINTYSSDIVFSIDFDNNIVIYSNIFVTMPNEEIEDGLKYHSALRNDAYFARVISNSSLDLVIPFDLVTIHFIKKLKDLKHKLRNQLSGSDTLIERNLQKIITQQIESRNCNTSPKEVWYQPDGKGDFLVWECKKVKLPGSNFPYNWIPVVDIKPTSVDVDDNFISPYMNTKGYKLKNQQFVEEVIFINKDSIKTVQ